MRAIVTKKKLCCVRGYLQVAVSNLLHVQVVNGVNQLREYLT